MKQTLTSLSTLVILFATGCASPGPTCYENDETPNFALYDPRSGSNWKRAMTVRDLPKDHWYRPLAKSDDQRIVVVLSEAGEDRSGFVQEEICDPPKTDGGLLLVLWDHYVEAHMGERIALYLPNK